MRRLKGCSDDSASTAWNYASLLYNVYRDAGPNRSHHSQTCRVQSSLNPFYAWYNVLLSDLHHSPSPPLEFLHTPTSPPPTPTLLYVH